MIDNPAVGLLSPSFILLPAQSALRQLSQKLLCFFLCQHRAHRIFFLLSDGRKNPAAGVDHGLHLIIQTVFGNSLQVQRSNVLDFTDALASVSNQISFLKHRYPQLSLKNDSCHGFSRPKHYTFIIPPIFLKGKSKSDKK